jgi:hypothetical protein
MLTHQARFCSRAAGAIPSLRHHPHLLGIARGKPGLTGAMFLCFYANYRPFGICSFAERE